MLKPLEKITTGNGLTYHKLAEFNNTILAYNFSKLPLPEIHYVTWKQCGQNDFEQGHYFCGRDDAINEQQAMRDFCVRSGLIRECDLLANEKLPDVMQMIERLRGKEQSPEDDKLLSGLQQQGDKIMNEPKEMYLNKEALIQEHDAQLAEPMEI